MNFETIGDIYAANDEARAGLKAVLADVTDAEANQLADGEKWTVAQLAEHIASVNDGVFRICRKLLGKAQEANLPAAAKLNVSDDFLSRSAEVHGVKLEAPERVHPTGTVTIGESLQKLDDNRRQLEELKPIFEEFDGDAAKFPHPYFGEISAVEWLIMAGGHEARHTTQIRKVLEKLRG
jgi:hypothetical protein